MTKKRSRDDKGDKDGKAVKGGKGGKSDMSQSSQSQSQSQEKIKKIKKKPKHEKGDTEMQVQGGGGGGGSLLPPLLSRGGSHPLLFRGISGDSLDGGESSLLPPLHPLTALSSGPIPHRIPQETERLLNKYFHLLEIKAFAQLYNALILSKSRKKVKDITPNMVKEKMQTIPNIDVQDLKQIDDDHHERFYTAGVVGISEDDLIHFLHWKYGCIPPDTDKLIRLYLKSYRINEDPNKERHTIYIRETWLTALKEASKRLLLQNKLVKEVQKEAKRRFLPPSIFQAPIQAPIQASIQAPTQQTKRLLQLVPYLLQVKQDNLKDLQQMLDGLYTPSSMGVFLKTHYGWKTKKPPQKHLVSFNDMTLAQAAVRQAKSKQIEQQQQKHRQLTCEVVVNPQTGELCGLPVFIWNPIDRRCECHLHA